MKPESIKAKADRKAAIIADYQSDMTPLEISEKYEISLGYARMLIREYKDRDVVKPVVKAVPVRLYAERDKALMRSLAKTAKRVTAKHKKPEGAKNNGYLMRLQNAEGAK